jgi:DnaJ-class molecular chaperone
MEESNSDNKEDNQLLMGSKVEYDELCPDCHGSGSFQDNTCSSCNGKGVI